MGLSLSWPADTQLQRDPAPIRGANGSIGGYVTTDRDVTNGTHPGILEDLGPIAAIKSIAQAFTRRTGVRMAIKMYMNEPCHPAAGAAVFRFVEEALANIGANARATSGSITIAPAGSRLVCTVCDDGAGFDVAGTLDRREHQRLGLMRMRDRLEAIGGTLQITSAPQRGTQLCAVIPHSARRHGVS